MPLAAFLSLLALSLAARVMASVMNSRRSIAIAALARQRKMQFVPHDRFGLAPRIAAGFPITGAADITVRDVVYASDERMYRWVFTAEFTVGVLWGQKRVRCAACFCEPRGQAEQPSEIRLADAKLRLVEQYQTLVEDQSLTR